MATSTSQQSSPQHHPQVAGQATLRAHNLQMVLDLLARSPEPISRADVAAQAGVTRATATSLVDALVAAGLAEELPPVFSGRAGRPAIPVRIARGTLAGVGAEIGVDYLGLRAVDLAGETVSEWITERDLRGSDPTKTLDLLAASTASMLTDLRAGGCRVAGVTLAVPGITDSPAGLVRLAPHLGWTTADPAAHLRTSIGQDLLGVENEANLAARSELARNSDARVASFCYVSGGYGIGAAIVIGGQVHTGAHGWAGEIGHVTIDPAGPSCTCGSNGCLELYASREAIMNAAGLDEQAPVPALGQAYQEGSAQARAAVATAAQALGVALANTFKLLDMSQVVLGGLFAPLVPALRPPLEAELRSRLPWAHWAAKDVTVSAAAHTDRPALTGAALRVTDRVFAQPTNYMEA